MVFPVHGASSFSHHEASSSNPPNPFPNEVSSSNPPEPLPILSLPEEITEAIAGKTLKQRAITSYQNFLTILIRNHGLFMQGLKFHPDYPFINVFHVHDLFRFPKEALCFFWYLFESHTIGISFNSIKLLSYILQCQLDTVPPHTCHLYTLFQWFLPAHQWMQKLSPCTKEYVVILFRKPCSFLPPRCIKN